MLVDLAKQALPVLAGLYGARLIANKIGPRLPGISSLGALASPVMAVGTVLLVNFATKKIAALAKYRTGLMLGAGLAALDSLVTAFAPASVKGMLGVGDIYDQAMGEYVAVGDYIQMGAEEELGDYIQVGADPIDDDIAMSGLGVEEELGLGVEEELGNDLLGGVSQSSIMKTVPTKRFLEPVPARSFTKEIRRAGPGYDNPNTLYQGIFAGGGVFGS
jgi:hypothetical protein